MKYHCISCILFLTCKFSLTADICTNSDVLIKSAVSFNSGWFFQKLIADYSASRISYGITIKFDLGWYFNITQWQATLNTTAEKLNDFYEIDIELNEEQRLLLPSHIAIPVAYGNFSFFYNIPNITTLNLTVSIIADIMLGNIIYWNDLAIEEVNPSAQLPAKKIVIFVTNDSMQNYYLSTFMRQYSIPWRKIYGAMSFFAWPFYNRSFSFSSDFQLLTNVSAKEYSMGYTSSVYFRPTNVQLARIVNVNREDTVSALPFAIRNGLKGVEINGDTFGTVSSGTYISEIYPFMYFINVVVKVTDKNPSKSCCAVQEVLGMIDYLLDYKLDLTQIASLYPLPYPVVKSIRSSVLTFVTCGGSKSFEEYKQYETLEAKAQQKRTITIGVSSAVSALLILIGTVLICYYRRLILIKQKFWIIPGNEIEFTPKAFLRNTEKSWLSVKSGLSENRAAGKSASQHAFAGDMFEGKVGFWKPKHKTTSLFLVENAKSPNFWKKSTKLQVANFCNNVSHINICLLYGVWTNSDGKSFTVSEFCEKGTLNYALTTSVYTVTVNVKYSLASDVIKGLAFLHQKGIVHGSLNSFTCQVNSLWTVKLSKWADHGILKSEKVVISTVLNVEEINDITETVKAVYLDPASVSPGIVGMSADVYSYGMLLVEIFTQKTPFFEEIELGHVSYRELLENKSRKMYNVPVMDNFYIPGDVQLLVTKLISAHESYRPDSASVAKSLQALRGNTSKSIVDIVLKTLECYVADLEEKVAERTIELTDITSRMRDLLNQLLPPQIASKFIKGETVQPEFFECASIVFSDIVGFTTISARSTPIQVMSFLNELWKEFDSVVEQFDVYKVDTIGDAYMVASGLPVRNGINHCKHAADLSMALIRLADTFVIPHLADDKLKIRLGINSGPVTAGIVGYKMPQYCVFGDTVNTASRMESTSLPFKIQVSESYHDLTLAYFPSYTFEYRGETDVKGKGIMKTYWLTGKDEVHSALLREVR